MFTTTNHLAVAPGFLLTWHMHACELQEFFVATNIIYQIESVVIFLHPRPCPNTWSDSFFSFHLRSSNTLSCVLLSHIYPPLLQFSRSESVTLFCFSSGVSVSFEFNLHRTLPALLHTIYIHVQPCMHSQTYTHAHTVIHKLSPPPQEQPNAHTHTHSMFQREWCLTGTSDSSLITSSL